MFDDDRRFITSDKFYNYYIDAECRRYEHQLYEYDKDGITLMNYRVILCEPKKSKGNKFYCAFNKATGEAVAEWKDSWEFSIKLFLLRDDEKQNNDIVNLAKKVNKKSKS